MNRIRNRSNRRCLCPLLLAPFLLALSLARGPVGGGPAGHIDAFCTAGSLMGRNTPQKSNRRGASAARLVSSGCASKSAKTAAVAEAQGSILSWRVLRELVWKQKAWLGVCLGASVVSTACVVGQKVFAGRLMQSAFVDRDVPGFWRFFRMAVCVNVATPFLKALADYSMKKVGINVASQIRQRMHRYMLNEIPLAALGSVDQVMSLWSSGIDKIQGRIGSQWFEHPLSLLASALLGAYLICARLLPRKQYMLVGIIAFIYAIPAFFIWISNKLSPKLILAGRNQIKAFKKIFEFADRDFGAAKHARAFNMQERLGGEFEDALRSGRKAETSKALWQAVLNLQGSLQSPITFIAIYLLLGFDEIPLWVYNSLFGLSMSYAASMKGLHRLYFDDKVNSLIIVSEVNKAMLRYQLERGEEAKEEEEEEAKEEGAKGAAFGRPLKLDNVTVCHGDRTILDRVHLDIQQGKITAVTGKNGAGKSTLLDAIIGFQRLKGGAVRFGNDDAGDFKDRLDAFAPVSQEARVFPGLTIQDNIVPGAGLKCNVSRSRFDSCVEAAGVMAFANDLPDKLDTIVEESSDGNNNSWKPSGGQKQSIAIATALYKDAPILVLDEPESSLDQKSKERLLEVLRAEAKKGKTVVIVTHDPHIEKQADVSVVIESGSVRVKRGVLTKHAEH